MNITLRPIRILKERCLFCGDTFLVFLYSDNQMAQISFIFKKADIVNHRIDCQRKFWEAKINNEVKNGRAERSIC